MRGIFLFMSQNIRNIAIIAHVDHGKTTLVDALLRQSEAFKVKEEEGGGLIMDSNELERERGITILSKNAAVQYKDFKINIVDTPGHADFGGEVERIMSLVDGVLLLVDAKDGPMPQTKFVLRQALQAGHRVIVVINKVDLPEARTDWVLNHTFDLFVELGASDAQAEFPVIYASAIQGKAGFEPDLAKMKDVAPIFDTILKEVPAPKIYSDRPMQMLVVNLSYDHFKGQIAVGRLFSGSLKKNQTVTRITMDGKHIPSRVTAVMTYSSLNRVETEEVFAGDVIAISGVEGIRIGDTIADPENPVALPLIKIEEPTVKMTFSINTSPFAGDEGEFSTARQMKDRLERELLNDVALRMENTSSDSSWIISGRGELHLSILIEKMRREGYEFQVAKPEVIMHEEDGVKKEPFEDVYIECPEAVAGTVIEKMGRRKGEMKDMKADRGITHLHFVVPTRGLIGYRSEFLSDTKGEGIFNTLFHDYLPHAGDMKAMQHGSLIAFEGGTATQYGLVAAQERGQLFIFPGTEVYEGMIVGKNAKSEDLEVNVCRAKKMSNMRSKGDGAADHFDTPKTLSLEECVEYLGDDELLEVTPKNLRLRKKSLSKNDRKK
jgi:GTP-binding protein